MFPSLSATIMPKALSCTAEIAAKPNRVASTRFARGRCPTALDMPEDRGPRLEAGTVLDLACQPLPYPTEAGVPECIDGVGRSRAPCLVSVRTFCGLRTL
jgi:hypothetical protein